MDLGIAGRHAIVAASSTGLGFACARSLANEGVNVTINGRDADRLRAAVEQLRATALGEISLVVGDITLFLIRDALDGMVSRRFGRIVNITSAMVKSPLSPMGLSSAARTGLISVVKGLSRDVAPANVTINNILPERINTNRQLTMATLTAQLNGITVDEAYVEMAQSIAAKRLGLPEEVGDACAYLCSAQAGFISGQSLHLDGGSYHGLF